MILAVILILHYRQGIKILVSDWGNVHKDEDNNIARNNVKIQTTMSTDVSKLFKGIFYDQYFDLRLIKMITVILYIGQNMIKKLRKICIRSYPRGQNPYRHTTTFKFVACLYFAQHCCLIGNVLVSRS